MKVYVVTDGDYSDYMIQEVFSNREAAEEYKYWHNIHNEIEVYDVLETAHTLDKRYMFIRVSGLVYPEAVVDLKYDIHPATVSDKSSKSYRGIYDYYRSNGTFILFNDHYVLAENWDEEKYKAKFTKALYDQAATVKAMFAEGADVSMVSAALRQTEDEE